MSLLVTGSIGIDTVETPHGRSEDCLGGSAIYFSMAASCFTTVRLVGVAGEDCPFDFQEVFAGRDIDLQGLESRNGSKTFRWHGAYSDSMNQRTDTVELNVLAEAPPLVPPCYRDSQFVFLANTAPALQQQLLAQLDGPQLVVADTMKLWIENDRPALLQLLQQIDGLVLNDQEALILSGRNNLVPAARDILSMGPKFVLIKKGEHGALLLTAADDRFALPAYPTEAVKDPTGAGDAFAGGMMGYLATCQTAALDDLKRAMAFGTVVASIAIEDFSVNALTKTDKAAIDKRFHQLQEMMQF